ncbi:NADP-dependent oxidoreductase [Rhodococcus sp. G-MC3]|uniref:MDR family NADP-dependent oxidoreductase n=1 Tax=Rhodococcus sp. G-MC3 TaxID=3046209 RepID=UPI0024BB2135|nr:NADP-dependent oxidoreductase [Rhodococcus sp. G-MC3]MDJ0395090.1 NADP-dependent oxidoreductase [Rhodococcus sp. G-MC3]
MSTAPSHYTRIALAEHLVDSVQDTQFTQQTGSISPIELDEVLVRIDFVQITAAFTDLMRADAEIPVPPYAVGDTVGGAAVGTVIASRSPSYVRGDLVLTIAGWSDHQVVAAQRLTKLDRDIVPSPAFYLNHGITAYHGMVDVVKAGKGDVVYVSGAAGGVGSLAGQIAKIRGATAVIGSAGTDEKVRYLIEELHFDEAFNYRNGDVVDQLSTAAPDGIDVFFDNVGGDQFEAAVQVANPGARFALCGAMSSQISKDRDAWPRLNLMTAITKNLSIFPFATYHTAEQIESWSVHFDRWLAEGTLVFPQTLLRGPITDAPQALRNLVAGRYRGNVALELEHRAH